MKRKDWKGKIQRDKETRRRTQAPATSLPASDRSSYRVIHPATGNLRQYWATFSSTLALLRTFSCDVWHQRKRNAIDAESFVGVETNTQGRDDMRVETSTLWPRRTTRHGSCSTAAAAHEDNEERNCRTILQFSWNRISPRGERTRGVGALMRGGRWGRRVGRARERGNMARGAQLRWSTKQRRGGAAVAAMRDSNSGGRQYRQQGSNGEVKDTSMGTGAGLETAGSGGKGRTGSLRGLSSSASWRQRVCQQRSGGKRDDVMYRARERSPSPSTVRNPIVGWDGEARRSG
ncbi:hypothetical protein B0H16DRAFT_1468001 [Mycena metata]|uniref:Uncharacterized protein n=1 Tax=Mycena metata TaxID=1033252 RepID=A0AAD7MVC8_9AGAR|nr:hypothetical protein B0H16DRAFT_1468001 [Mycena metata]